MTLLAPTLQGFFTDRLIGQRHASPHTITAYRDTLRMLLAFAAQHTTKQPSLLEIDDLDAPLIGAFLDHLEHERANTIRTRNTRLAAIRSLFKYAALKHPEHAATIQRVLAIPSKRFDQALVTFLTDPELDALLDAPDRSTWIGRRDHALILLAAQTGLRVSELTSLTCSDIRLGDRRARQLPRERPQTTDHPADQADHRRPQRLDARTRGRTRRPALHHHHRPCAQPRRARAPPRQTRRHRHHHLPVAQSQDDLTPRAPSHRGDATAASRRRHHRYRPLARP